MNMDTSALLQRAIEIAVAAGRQILGYYAQDLAVESKEDNSPLTAADRAAHEVICAGLRDLSPRLPVWSEESADITWETRRGWRDFWLVDPLDGTREFLKRNGEFTVNIALVSNHCPLLGVVHAPALGRDYWGSPNGAFRRDAGREPLPLRVAAPGPGPIRVVGSRSHRGDSLAAFLGRLGPHVLVPVGSSLKFCLVAEGAADVYPRLGPTSEWDTAAAQAVLEAAGGSVRDLNGLPLRYNRGADRLNPEFVAAGGSDRDWLALLKA